MDLVVLCQALVPPSSQPEIAKRLGIELDDAGFVRIPDKLARPVDTTVAGIFACGCCLGPQDIPDTRSEDVTAVLSRLIKFTAAGLRGMAPSEARGGES